MTERRKVEQKERRVRKRKGGKERDSERNRKRGIGKLDFKRWSIVFCGVLHSVGKNELTLGQLRISLNEGIEAGRAKGGK